MAAPNLVIQLQRMGDLVLTFPLLAWLQQMEPDHPVWVCAEPGFYEGLMPLSPKAAYFGPQAIPQLTHTPFHRVINLSTRPQAADFAAAISQAHMRIGPLRQGGITRIQGNWQLYRSSLVSNNRHNLFHWSDLNALDIVSPTTLPYTLWPAPRKPKGSGWVGLFVGASQPQKRPDASFWAHLASSLVRMGLKPLFLGGQDEAELTAQAARLAGLPDLNFAGRFTLAQLAQFVPTLDLLVTPDTGPMHLSAWANTLCLNLSMGPVNPWETAPASPGHLVLRPGASCTGCWQCHTSSPPCKAWFSPLPVARLIGQILNNEPVTPLPGLRLLRTARTRLGLYQLEPAPIRPLNTTEPGSQPWQEAPGQARYALGNFWRHWFLERLGGPPGDAALALAELATANPVSPGMLKSGLAASQALLAPMVGQKSLDSTFWRQAPPSLRPLTSYLQFRLENQDGSRMAWKQTLEDLEHLAALLHTL